MPSLSTATQNVVVGQDTAFSEFGASTAAIVHAPTPPVGSVDVRTLPFASTATHSVSVGHEIPLICTGVAPAA